MRGMAKACCNATYFQVALKYFYHTDSRTMSRIYPVYFCPQILPLFDVLDFAFAMQAE
jgi:hypothetical protein